MIQLKINDHDVSIYNAICQKADINPAEINVVRAWPAGAASGRTYRQSVGFATMNLIFVVENELDASRIIAELKQPSEMSQNGALITKRYGRNVYKFIGTIDSSSLTYYAPDKLQLNVSLIGYKADATRTTSINFGRTYITETTANAPTPLIIDVESSDPNFIATVDINNKSFRFRGKGVATKVTVDAERGIVYINGDTLAQGIEHFDADELPIIDLGTVEADDAGRRQIRMTSSSASSGTVTITFLERWL